MKKTILNLIKLSLVAVSLMVSTSVLNAQITGGSISPSPTSNDGPGGPLDPNAPEVPFEDDMAVMLIVSALLFVTYKYKKGELSLISK